MRYRVYPGRIDDQGEISRDITPETPATFWSVESAMTNGEWYVVADMESEGVAVAVVTLLEAHHVDLSPTDPQ